MAKTTKKRRRLWGRVKPDPNIYYRTYKKKKGLESFDSKPFLLVREMGLEPTRLNTRTSNVPVCRFQHSRMTARCILPQHTPKSQ